MKKTGTLGFKLIIMFLVFLLIVLGSCGFITYLNQMNIYRQQCETEVRSVGEYLSALILADDFVRYQDCFMRHFTEVDIPMDADDYVSYYKAYDKLFRQNYPGKALGVDIEFDELSDDVQRAYLVYRHMYWLLTFEQARDNFGLSSASYIVPNSERSTMTYMIDFMRESRAEHIEYTTGDPSYFDHPQGDEADIMYLAEEVVNDKESHKYDEEWAAWESEEKRTGFQVWHNEFGDTYAYYTPLIIDGQKLGLIDCEIDIDKVNQVILNNTIRQFGVIGLILLASLVIMVTFINRRYIRRVADLEASVREYAKTKDADVAEGIRKGIRGHDEVQSLSEGVAQMIEEIQTYINNIVTIHQELEQANTKAEVMSELALKDGLTNIRNRTAYDQETEKLDRRMKQENVRFAIVMIDLNNLKIYNDTYGHEQGNEAIIGLSRMVCRIFKHSMVFRIGGDEFVAILLNDDCENGEALIQQLRSEFEALDRDETLQPWEKINAAVGLATYDPKEDSSVEEEDVFRRADAQMYQNKKQMKGNARR